MGDHPWGNYIAWAVLIAGLVVLAAAVFVFMGPIEPYVHQPIESLEQLQ